MGGQLIDIASVRPGMHLSSDIVSKDGKVMYPAGSIVTQAMLLTLRSAGILRISIATGDFSSTTTTSISEEIIEEAKAALADTFALLPRNDSINEAIYAIALERQSKALVNRPGRAAPAKKNYTPQQTQKPEAVSLKKLLNSGSKIGTLPIIFHRLIEIINSPAGSSGNVAKVLEADPALCAKLLRLVNSPFYGLSTRIDTIPRAVVMVGTGQLVMLAMGATLVTSFKGIPVSLINMQNFWSHSLACGVASRLLAKHADLDQPESYFVAGLLHDIARLIIYTQIPNHAMYLLSESDRLGCSVHSLEKDVLGFTHEELGAELLLSWSCPAELVKRVERHHRTSSNISKEYAILPAANMLAQAFGFGTSGELRPEPINEMVWSLLGVEPDMLPDLSKKMDDNVLELRSTLSPG